MQSVILNNRKFNLFLSEKSLRLRISELAKQINRDFEGKRPLFIAVLNGSFFFASDLLREISLPCEISFVKLASYKGTASTGKIRQLIGLDEDLFGRNIIILEDIIDSGLTMKNLLEFLSAQEPASLSIATLLFKKASLKVEIVANYIGFEVPNDFLVGYGLDFDKIGRNLTDIYKIE